MKHGCIGDAGPPGRPLLIRPEAFGATVYDPRSLEYFFAEGDQLRKLRAFLTEGDASLLGSGNSFSTSGEDLSGGRFVRAMKGLEAGVGLAMRRTPAPIPTDTLAAPIRVYFEVTRCCNARCHYCLNDAGAQRDDGLSSEEILRVIDSLGDDGVLEVRLTGGEPTLHPSFPEMARRVREGGMALSVNSNLLDLERSVLPLAAIRPDLIITSLDACEVAHGRSRGAGFERIAENVRRLREGGLPVRLNCMLNADTLGEIDGFMDEFATIGCGFCFILTRPVGRARDTNDFANLDDLIEANRRIDAKRLEYPEIYISTSFHVVMDREFRIGDIELTGCNAIQKSFNVNSDGSVLPCAFLYELSPERFGLGNVRDHDFSVLPIWRGSPLLKELRLQSAHSNARCISCDRFRKDCLGSCVFMEKYSDLTGRPDPYCRRSLACAGRSPA
jgi:radical SAM protein with 4Fe4S-binding SPASM domain